MVKVVFFDWFKTLCDVEDVYPISEELNEEKQYELLTVSGLGDLSVSNEKKEKVREFLNGADFNLYEDTEDFIKLLKDKGCYVGIISDMFAGTNNRIREEFEDVLSLFDVVSLSPEIGLDKSSNTVLLKTLEKLNENIGKKFSPEDVIMVGDNSKRDIDNAHSCGMKGILIDRSSQKLKDVFAEVNL